MTRWSSQAPRNTSRRIQWTSERSEGPLRSPQQSLTCSPSSSEARHLAVHGQVHEVLALVVAERPVDEPELRGGLLDTLGEVALVEREAQLSVLEHVVRTGLVVSSAGGVVDKVWPGAGRGAGRRDLTFDSSAAGALRPPCRQEDHSGDGCV